MENKKQKLIALNINSLDDLNDEHVNILYKNIILDKKNYTNSISKNIDKSNDKYKIALKFINKISNMMKEKGYKLKRRKEGMIFLGLRLKNIDIKLTDALV